MHYLFALALALYQLVIDSLASFPFPYECHLPTTIYPLRDVVKTPYILLKYNRACILFPTHVGVKGKVVGNEAEIMSLFKEHLAPTEIAARLNLSVGEVRKHIATAGYEPSRPVWMAQALGAQFNRIEIGRLHFEGNPPELIAEKLGLDLGYVTRRLREEGLEPHTEPEKIEQAKRKHEEILAMGREDVPRYEIAKRTGVPWPLVSSALETASIRPILPACADIAAWVGTLTPVIEEIGRARPDTEPLQRKVSHLETELVNVLEALSKTQERVPWTKVDKERWCLADISYLTNRSLDLIGSLKGCVRQLDTVKLPHLLEQAETCTRNICNIMGGAISEAKASAER